MNEKDFENKIRTFLNKNNIYHFKFFGGLVNTRSSNFVKTRKGVPDLICCINGIFVGLEIKSEKGKYSTEQLENFLEINKNKGLCFIVYPKDFELLKICILELLENSENKELIRIKYLKISDNIK